LGIKFSKPVTIITDIIMVSENSSGTNKNKTCHQAACHCKPISVEKGNKEEA